MASSLLQRLGYAPAGGVLAPRRFSLGPPLDLQAAMNEEFVASQSPGSPLADPGQMAVAKGSGLSKWEEEKNKLRREQRANQNTYLTEDQVQDLYRNIDMLPEVQSAKQGLAIQEQMLEREINRPVGNDHVTGPLLGLLRSEFGRDVSAYPRPDTSGRKSALDFSAKLQDDRTALAKTYIEGIGKQKSGTLADLFASEAFSNMGIKGSDPSGRSGVNRAALDADRYIKTFRTDQTVKDARIASDAGRDIQSLTNKHNWVVDSNLRASLTKAAGLYPISDRDIEAFGGDPSLEEKFNRFMGKVMDGKPFTAEDRAAIIEYGRLVEAVKEAELEQMAKNYAEELGPEYGYDPEDAVSKLRLWRGLKGTAKGTSNKMQPPPVKKAKGGAKTGGMTPEQKKRLEELRKKHGK